MRNADDEKDTFQSIGMAADRLVSNLIKPREPPKMPDGTLVVSAGSIRRGFEISQMYVPSIDANAGRISISTVSIDALKSGRRRDGLLVRVILPTGSRAQIAKGVVIAPSVDVVDEVIGPPSRHIEPRHSRSAIERAVDANEVVSLRRAGAASAAPNQVAASGFLPREDPRRGVVVQGISKFVSGKHLQPSQRAEKQQEESAKDRRRSEQNEQTAERHSEYVEQRLRDLSAFERKARGNQKRR